MALYEENMFEDLAYDEAEGAADAYDEFDEFDEGDEFDEADELEAADEFDEGDEFDAADEDEGFDEADELEAAEFDEFGDVDAYDEDGFEDEDALETALATALAAEDTDEFFRRAGRALRRAARGAVRVARRAAPIVGRIARAATPILRVIPHPAARAAATAAQLLGRLRFESASEDEALEALAEFAARNPAALPVVAGVAARSLVRRAGAALPPAARRAAVRTTVRAARSLVRRLGPAAIRALPRVVRSVRRTAAARRTPPALRPRIALNTARRVAASARLVRRLARPLPRGRAVLRQAIAGARGRIGMRGVRPMRGMGMRGRGMRVPARAIQPLSHVTLHSPEGDERPRPGHR